MVIAASSGFLLGLGLIVAIGAQNAFVLRQGLLRRHVLGICLACALSDAVLIAAGVAGFGTLVGRLPWLVPAMRYAGAAFLVFYGLRSLRAALAGNDRLDPADSGPESLAATLLACLALTWLNPHVYLDTVVLIGSLAQQYGDDRFAFAIGACTASFIFFFSLGYGARLLTPLFARPGAWRVLDAAICLVMWMIAGRLMLEA